VDDADRFRLLGKYRTPRVRVGRIVRGEVEVAGFTDGPTSLLPPPGLSSARVGSATVCKLADRPSTGRRTETWRWKVNVKHLTGNIRFFLLFDKEDRVAKHIVRWVGTGL
jgi:hypothetical protein